MPRVSRKQAEQNRQDVIDAASRLFREHGIDGVSVPAVMAEAGLTHGAFYGQFDSKEALAEAACARAFEQSRQIYAEIDARHGGDIEAVRTEFIKRYTAKSHRDQPGHGCLVAALGGDIARPEMEGRVRSTFAAGVASMVERVQSLLVPRKKKKATRQEALAAVATLVGGLVLARATRGHEISDEMLAAVRKTLLES
jgi:TetR/AcrR family transcriptional regulator, transcriptional repressor for nem operon